MQSAVRSQFSDLIWEHCDHSGFAAPPQLIEYIIDIVAERFDRPDFVPEPTFAESYLRLYAQYRPSLYREFADSTLIFCSLLPDYGLRRGLNMDYYATMGISTYYTLGDLSRDPRFTQLGNWFYHLQRFLCSALHRDRPLQLVDW